MKENSDGSDTNVGSIGNSIEEDIKIIEDFILKTDVDYSEYNEQIVGNISYQAIQHLLSAYKKILKENERYKKSDYETICLENNELREITDRIQSEYKDLLKDNFKLKNELETKRKEYQETYKDVREELKELRKENEELNNRCRNLDKEAQAYLEELAGDNTLTRRTIKQLQEENEELKNKLSLKQFDVNIVYNDYLEKLDEYEKNNIPKQKVKDKIEQLEKNELFGKYNFEQIKFAVDALQELLEGREKYDRGRKESY